MDTARKDAYSAAILPALTAPTLLRANFAGTCRFAKTPVQRATLRPVDLAEGRRLQLSRFDGRKVLYSNHTAEELPVALADILAAGFSNVHISTTTEEIDLRLTKKGDLLIGRKPRHARASGTPPSAAHATAVSDVTVAIAPHNRTKEVPLPEGQADPLLEAMGILNRNHRVRPTMRDKFTQINEFLKLLDHVLPKAIEHRPRHAEDATLLILDCGCGSSLLTLATAHFLTHIKHLPARVVGIDQNAEVIATSQARAAQLPDLKIEFRQARIGHISDLTADIVLALHACDTATDDAIAQAVRSQAQLLLAVPCCHQNLNAQLQIPDLAPIHLHGILHQRQADIITDTFRALLLEVMGYRAEVIEFISAEHTARNLMLRAVRARASGDRAAMTAYSRFKTFCGVTPYLETALADLVPAALRVAQV